MTKDGMVGFAQLFDLAASLKTALPKVKAIWEAKTLDTPTVRDRSTNQQIVANFFWAEYAEKYFGAKIGFNQETDDLSLWPGDMAVKRYSTDCGVSSLTSLRISL